MKKLLMTAAALLMAVPALAEEGKFSANSQAKPWNLFGEETARFTAKVTDGLCALTGDCPDDCGGGERQMVLIRDADNAVVLANKNGQPIFSGATVDLAAYCGQHVEVDGLLIGDPELTPGLTAKVFMVQTIKPVDADEFAKANLFSKAWEEKHPEAQGKGPWFRRDPGVKAEIERTGYFGIGHEVDKKYLEENPQ
ncbi:hypothetical protein H2509_11160 [Stappia sp. F7233]|uniref:Uncharacterized protein n=1 Tax=Stappia albiluteola TaxID=2758565 RepID=A0A839AFM2_9HYPH|nr:hypothetical protein [Stappia albiluteola]MBA5777682.1 hypothetical protein [Stappia albiluteola]